MKAKESTAILILIIIFAFSACQKSANENAKVIDQNLPNSDASPETLYKSIREVDFKNFTYQFPEFRDEAFTLKNGRKEQTKEEDGAGLGNIEYGDATNDGEEEAMLRIQPITGGNCQCEMVFIYTLKNNKPKLLWSFDTWDKAVGGLKQVYTKNGKLIVELFGDSEFENGKFDFGIAEGKFKGYCCPTTFRKFIFEWNDEKFVLKEKSEMFDYEWKNQIKSRQFEIKKYA